MFAQRVCILELILAPNAEAYMDAAVHVAGVGLRRRWSWQGLQLFVDCVVCCFRGFSKPTKHDSGFGRCRLNSDSKDQKGMSQCELLAGQ